MSADAVSVLEAAYAITLPEREWVAQLAAAFYEAFPLGDGCMSYAYDASGSRLETRSTATARLAVAGEIVDQVHESVPEQLMAALYDPSPRVALASEIIDRERHRELWDAVANSLMPGVKDFVGIRAGGPDRRGLLVAFPVRKELDFSPPRRDLLTHVAAHVAAAFRLRVEDEPFELGGASAILDEAAHVQHLADDEARAGSGEIVDAVLRMKAAKTRRVDGNQSVAEWRALVAGRWSVIDYADRDGKRFVVARRNQPYGRNRLAITDTERQVLAHAALGYSNKLIAYELGLAMSTVSVHLRRGLAKLGLKNRTELIGLSP
jgi:DNA-binding CsgD family transcriptional regulator